MGLEKLSLDILLLICLGVTVSGQITMSNPSTLASVTEIKASMPFAINCNADVVGLPGQIDAVTRLQIHRMLHGETQESLIVDFNPYYIIPNSQRITDIPAGRDWSINFPNAPNPPTAENRDMNLKLDVNDALCGDAGIYQCTVSYASPTGAVDSLGQQNLTAKAALRNTRITLLPSNFNNQYRENENLAMICRADGPPNLQMEWWSGVSGSGDYRPVAPLADIVDEDPFSILNDDCNSMRYKSTFKPQLTQAGDDITFMCVVRDGQETMSANVTLSISPAATMNMETVSPAKEEEPGDGGDDTIVLALGVSVAVLAVLVVALILLILLLRFRRSKKMPEVEPPMPIRPVETVANLADGYEVPVEHSEGGSMRPEDDRQLSIYQYDEIDNSPYSHDAVPN